MKEEMGKEEKLDKISLKVQRGGGGDDFLI